LRARGRARGAARLHREAARLARLYRDGSRAGSARVAAEAQSAVLPQHRGRGLGVELVPDAVARGPHARLEWRLRTADAHELRRRFGSREVDEALTERPPK
jgi:GNAT superfamily N-acetyltransferase